jgi:hypothetical protein
MEAVANETEFDLQVHGKGLPDHKCRRALGKDHEVYLGLWRTGCDLHRHHK